MPATRPLSALRLRAKRRSTEKNGRKRPMNINRALNVADLRRLARRRLPRVVFEHIDCGLEDDEGTARNQTAFRAFHLVPRYLIDVSKRDLSTNLFGRNYDMPFGIAPTGLASLARHDGDLLLAEAAEQARIPFVLSGAGNKSIEAVARVAPSSAWCQVYCARDPRITDDMIRRAAESGVTTLVITVDTPVHSNRERNIRNGFVRPYRISLAGILEALTHPGWIAEYLQQGFPRFEAWAPYIEGGAQATATATAAVVQKQLPAPQTWADIERYRRAWQGKLVIKGIMHPDDAVRCFQLGADGIVVSNHGGRQLDRAPAAITMLGPIRQAVGNEPVVMFDSGIRRGTDIAVALCLGANFVFAGRPTLYGLAAGGSSGVLRCLQILRRELDLVMGQMGCIDIKSFSRALLMNAASSEFLR